MSFLTDEPNIIYFRRSRERPAEEHGFFNMNDCSNLKDEYAHADNQKSKER
jgi:hypothetical protein